MEGDLIHRIEDDKLVEMDAIKYACDTDGDSSSENDSRNRQVEYYFHLLHSLFIMLLLVIHILI